MAANTTKCPACSFQNRPEALFCGQCGVTLNPQPPTQEIAQSQHVPVLLEPSQEPTPEIPEQALQPTRSSPSSSVEEVEEAHPPVSQDNADLIHLSPTRPTHRSNFSHLIYWASGLAGLLIGLYVLIEATVAASPIAGVFLSLDAGGVITLAVMHVLVGQLRRSSLAWRFLAERIVAAMSLAWGIVGMLLGAAAMEVLSSRTYAVETGIYFSTVWNILGGIALGAIVILYAYLIRPAGLAARITGPRGYNPAPSALAAGPVETISRYPGAYCIQCGMPLMRDDRFCPHCGRLKEF